MNNEVRGSLELWLLYASHGASEENTGGRRRLRGNKSRSGEFGGPGSSVSPRVYSAITRGARPSNYDGRERAWLHTWPGDDALTRAADRRLVKVEVRCVSWIVGTCGSRRGTCSFRDNNGHSESYFCKIVLFIRKSWVTLHDTFSECILWKFREGCLTFWPTQFVKERHLFWNFYILLLRILFAKARQLQNTRIHYSLITRPIVF